MVYQRTAEQRRHDLANAKAYENYVADAIGVPVHSRFTSKTDLDLWHPGYFIEIKEKNQPLTPRWHILEHCEERNLFVLDELTVRKALRWYPEVFLLVRDNSGGDPDPRLFLIPIWELIALPKARVDRDKKGKWVLNLGDFTRIATEEDIPPYAHYALTEQLWKRPQCLGGVVGQV